MCSINVEREVCIRQRSQPLHCEQCDISRYLDIKNMHIIINTFIFLFYVHCGYLPEYENYSYNSSGTAVNNIEHREIEK